MVCRRPISFVQSKREFDQLACALFLFFLEVIPIDYNLLFAGDIFSTNLKEQIALNRGLPSNWCTRFFMDRPSFDFDGLKTASEVLKSHLFLGKKEKFQIIVDSDFDGISSAAIAYRYLCKFFPEIECVYSIHSKKKHGLSSDIEIDDDTTLVIAPDSATNDTEQCKTLVERGVDVLVLDHHEIEQPNPYAAIVNCMDGKYPNTSLCGAAVTWLFFYGYAYNDVLSNFEEHEQFLMDMLDLVAIATIADVMSVTNEDNMYFIQRGLDNVTNSALRAFCESLEINVNAVTIEHVKFKIAPLVSAMIRMGSMDEKTLLFRAFVEDYEEFTYEKRGSFDISVESIYDRVVRLCKNAKSRQDRAKQKLLEECKIYEYPHVLLVEYEGESASSLTGLVANELANKYSKPCIVYKERNGTKDEYDNYKDAGSIRNYDGSPIESFKDLLQNAFQNYAEVAGHANSAGITMEHTSPDIVAELIAENIPEDILNKVGTKKFNADFAVNAGDVDAGFVSRMAYFDHYSGYGFAPVTAFVSGIVATSENFQTMGKNSINWKIVDADTGVSFVKFKVDQSSDKLIQIFDDIEWDSETDNGKLYDDFGRSYLVDAICTFGLNVYKGEIHPQCVVLDYSIRPVEEEKNPDEDDNFDLDFDL